MLERDVEAEEGTSDGVPSHLGGRMATYQYQAPAGGPAAASQRFVRLLGEQAGCCGAWGLAEGPDGGGDMTSVYGSLWQTERSTPRLPVTWPGRGMMALFDSEGIAPTGAPEAGPSRSSLRRSQRLQRAEGREQWPTALPESRGQLDDSARWHVLLRSCTGGREAVVVDGDLTIGFEEAFEPLRRCAYRAAYRLLGEQAAAEDVAAEGLARTYAPVLGGR